MRVVVTGRFGQVAQSLIERAPDDMEVVALGRPEFDLARESSSIVSALSEACPDIIVSAAAYTQVDKAESEPAVAFAVNAQGPRAVAVAARQCGVPLIHLSTDYVFDGKKSSPYVEDDQTCPASVYGASKLAGEQAVLSEHSNSVVLRTAWVYSPFAANFVKTMLGLAAGRDEINVVADQRGNPTSAIDIADALLALAANLTDDDDDGGRRGVFHMTAGGEASWAEFAELIFQRSADVGGPSARINPIRTSEYPTAATRPSNSRLDSNRLKRAHGLSLPDWHSSLGIVVSRLLDAERGGNRA